MIRRFVLELHYTIHSRYSSPYIYYLREIQHFVYPNDFIICCKGFSKCDKLVSS